MSSRLENTAAELGIANSYRALLLGIAVVVFLGLYGWVPGRAVPWLLGSIAAGRSAFLLAEALRTRRTPADWDEIRRRHLDFFSRLTPDELAIEAREWELPGATSGEQLAEVLVQELRKQHMEPRPRRELAAEWIGLVAFALILPFAFALFTRDIVSTRTGQDVLDIGALAVLLALYAWPHRWARSEGVGDRRSLWWSVAMVPAATLAYVGVTLHHPYLDPRRSDRAELRAERVLSLDNIVLAGAHADWVFDYAAELEAQGQPERAADYYRRGLHVAPRDRAAHARLAALEGRQGSESAAALRDGADPRERARGLSPGEFAALPFWPSGRPLHPVRSCRVDPSLEQVAGTTVVLVPVGEVPVALTDAVGDVIQEELALPVCRAAPGPALPDATRVRGLVFGRQWSVDSLAVAFRDWGQPFPEAPLKFLLVTPVDIYARDTNFLFSATYPWGALLSYARLGDPESDPEKLRQRTAKQALGALLKSFGLPPSRNSDCVTSYTNGLPQFDAKGNRPDTQSYLSFRSRVEAEDRRWRAHRARHRAGG